MKFRRQICILAARLPPTMKAYGANITKPIKDYSTDQLLSGDNQTQPQLGFEPHNPTVAGLSLPLGRQNCVISPRKLNTDTLTQIESKAYVTGTHYYTHRPNCLSLYTFPCQSTDAGV